MKNSQLDTLLERSSLNEEDIYNVRVIFQSLSDERKILILENWEKYLAKLLQERKRLDAEQNAEVLEILGRANTLLDATIAQYQAINQEKKIRAKHTQEELASAIKYDEMQKIRNIRNACKMP